MGYSQQQMHVQQQNNNNWPQWQQQQLQQVETKTTMHSGGHNSYNTAPSSTPTSFSSHHRSAPYSLPTHSGKYNTATTSSHLQQYSVNLLSF